jgi:hypothetical protein
VGDDRDRRASGTKVFRRETTDGRTLTEHVEEVLIDRDGTVRPAVTNGAGVPPQLHRGGLQSGNRIAPRRDLVHLEDPAAPARTTRGDHRQVLGIGKRQRLEQDAIDNREDRRAQSGAESDDRHNGQRVPRGSVKRPQRLANLNFARRRVRADPPDVRQRESRRAMKLQLGRAKRETVSQDVRDRSGPQNRRLQRMAPDGATLLNELPDHVRTVAAAERHWEQPEHQSIDRIAEARHRRSFRSRALRDFATSAASRCVSARATDLPSSVN